MGKHRVAFLLGLVAVAGLAVRCNGGVTSAYRRILAASVDMPLDADVFQVPAGYNAPQQVRINLFNPIMLIVNSVKNNFFVQQLVLRNAHKFCRIRFTGLGLN